MKFLIRCPGCKKLGIKSKMHEWDTEEFWHGGCIEEELARDACYAEGYQAMVDEAFSPRAQRHREREAEWREFCLRDIGYYIEDWR